MANLKSSPKVRYLANDNSTEISQNANMSKRKKFPAKETDWARLKNESGWNLKAWREWFGISQEVLADRMRTSKGVVSELESGKARFNRDTLWAASEALGVLPGDLIDRNPFKWPENTAVIVQDGPKLDPRDQDTVAELVKSLLRRK
jgi:transcriptional regulator with XRE-family HTH domain